MGIGSKVQKLSGECKKSSASGLNTHACHADMHALMRCPFCGRYTRVKIEKINNLFQVDINRREQGCAANYEQCCQHVVTTLFNCNNLEQHG
jgi:hypothetical protein